MKESHEESQEVCLSGDDELERERENKEREKDWRERVKWKEEEKEDILNIIIGQE